MENCNFFTCYRGVGSKCTHVSKYDGYGGESLFRTRKPVRAIDFYVLSVSTDYVLLKNFYIDLLLEKMGKFKKFHSNEVYVYVRVVLTRVDL